ncbi:hypothetical protein [Humisphaera borealis]|uniref:Condensation domain-containing protein n=1 Tax=Humisphaera borealis TaxID=2807512 RepID=A0A7M2WSL0_9BACT|nr:hypothetical protein [Humisphaera borealis]QOV88487.1 hypothetical protein IPV69_19880 [Humisphaera borealis]
MNAFQRMLRGWEVVHPYNAAQVLELRCPVGVDAASAAWSATMEDMNLGRVEAKVISYRHFGLNGEMSRFPVRLLPPGTCLETYLGDELNRPFSDPGEPPFRPFILPDASSGTFHFGVVYQHWVADSVAVRHMLRRWLERMFRPPAAWKPLRMRHANIGYLGLLELSPGPMEPVQTMLSMIRRHMRYRKARKCKTLGKDDYPVRVIMQDAPGLIGGLTRAAKRLGVKVHDLFLTAATRVCDERIPTQHRKSRTDLAIGSIIDLRPLARGALDDRFGLFLGFAEVISRPDEIKRRHKLLASIARQNHLHRQRGIWPSSVGYLLLAMATRPLVKPSKLYSFFRKETPMIAGVSNVNLSSTWVAEFGDLIAKYRRISPTGPLAPVVFAVTSLGDDLQLSITYRDALLTREQAAELGAAFVTELRSLIAE